VKVKPNLVQKKNVPGRKKNVCTRNIRIVLYHQRTTASVLLKTKLCYYIPSIVDKIRNNVDLVTFVLEMN